MSPAARRRAVLRLVGRGFPLRLSCRACGLSRGAAKRAPKERSPGLRGQVLDLAEANPRYGFRRVAALLPGVNLKAVHRVWRQEGLSLKGRKRRRLKVPRQPAPALTGPNQSWCLDFLHERLESGRQARVLAVLDCFTRECLALKAAPSLRGHDVAAELEWLFLVHGKPATLRSDNGPEFRSSGLASRLAESGVGQAFILPGKPWQNGHVESFFGKLRDELLQCQSFPRGADLQAALDDFAEHYDRHRPHSALGGMTPARFKEQFMTTMEAEGVKL